MMSDITEFLNNNEDREGQTAQSTIGMKYVLRGQTTKHWEDVNELQPK